MKAKVISHTNNQYLSDLSFRKNVINGFLSSEKQLEKEMRIKTEIRNHLLDYTFKYSKAEDIALLKNFGENVVNVLYGAFLRYTGILGDITIPQTINKFIAENKSLYEKEKFYAVSIEEINKRTVLISATNSDDVYEIAELLCDEGIIDLDVEDFVSRNVVVIGIEENAEDSFYPKYNSEGEIK